MMKIDNLNTYFFIFILILISSAALIIFKPFFTSILTAAILAVIFQRPYQFFLRRTKNRKALSSLLTSLLIVLLIVVPFLDLLTLVSSQINDIINRNVLSEKYDYHSFLAKIEVYLEKIPFIDTLNLKEIVNPSVIMNGAKEAGKGALNIIGGVYRGIVGFIFWIFVMFFSLYYFFIDGEMIVKKLIYLSPLTEEHEGKLIKSFVSIVRATLKGMFIIGIIQGVIGGIAFAIAGVPSSFIWAVFMIILSLIPLVGSGLIWLPGGIIMIVMGDIWQGVLILTVGFGIISTIDNLLRPKLIGQDTQMHPLIVFFATFGGILVFGLVGFILGPIVMALFLASWEIYAAEFKHQLENYNS
ncbi:Uncharacterized protein MCHI_001425 [Candidatus Magnetoovum chiemensis]|nr:Uncharacterized protein MCHI_001425 [Candidatus Magnetoovum chiemensis]